MPIQIDVTGLEEAAEILAIVSGLPKVPIGARFAGPPRAGGLSNAELLDHLAEGGRDIRPTEEDSLGAAVIFRDKVEEKLRSVALRSARKAGKAKIGAMGLDAKAARSLVRRHNKALKGWASDAGASDLLGAASNRQKAARAAAASGFRAAATALAEKMQRLVATGETNDGRDADAVDPTYAARREKRYGVPRSAVFVATGQLIRALLEGTVRLVGKRK